MKAYDAGSFLEAVDENRSPSPRSVGMCASCGTRPPAPGFLMCTECRAGIGESDIGRRSNARLRAITKVKRQLEHVKQMKPARAPTPKKEEVMPRKKPQPTYRYHCPIEGCYWCSNSAQGLRIHRGQHHKTEEARAIIEAYIAEIDGKQKPKSLTPDTTLREIVEQGGTVELVPKAEPVADQAAVNEALDSAGAVVEEATCDKPCSVDPCPGVEACDCGEDTVCAGGCDVETEQSAEEIVPKPFTVTPVTDKTITVNVEVSDMPIIKARYLRYEQLIDILAERVAELQNQRRPWFSKAMPWKAIEMRDWAECQLDRRKREAFRARMQQAVDDIESALFDEHEDDAA